MAVKDNKIGQQEEFFNLVMNFNVQYKALPGEHVDDFWIK